MGELLSSTKFRYANRESPVAKQATHPFLLTIEMTAYSDNPK
jgi:hypothetical protein